VQIHQVKTRFSNSYVIEESDQLLVIDVALRCDGWVLRFVEEQLGRTVSDISLVVCTHDDPDHIGGVHALARAAGAQMGIPHASKRPHLKFLNNPLGSAYKFATGFREAFRPRSREMYNNRDRLKRYEHVPNHHLNNPVNHRFVVPEHRLKHNNLLNGFPNWSVLHTPGHSWDSICFFHEQTRSLVTGDTVLGSGKKGHLVHPAIYDNPGDLQKTLIRLQQLDPRTVYPGHGSIFDGEDLLSHL